MFGDRSRPECDTFFEEVRKIAALAWPVLIAQLAFVSFGVLDTMIVGRYATVDLAAISLGAAVNASVYMGLASILYALQPIVGQNFGTARYRRIGELVRQAAWLAAVLMVVGALVLHYPRLILQIADSTDEVNIRSTQYLGILSFCLPARMVFGIFASLSNAVSKPRLPMLILVGTLIVKFLLNLWFVRGGYGLPEFGGPGAALATFVATWLSAIACITVMSRHPYYRQFAIFRRFSRPRWCHLRAMLVLGIPMALSSLIEVSSYTCMTLFIGRFGAVQLAAHQIASNLGAVLYMVPLSIAIATLTLVSQKIGANEPAAARTLSRTGVSLAAFCAVMSSTLVMMASVVIVAAYTSDLRVAAAAMPLVQAVAFYHLADAIQLNAAFALRAYKVTMMPAIIYAVASMGIGVGGGYVAGFDVFHVMPATLIGARGFWWAGTASLVIVAVCLLVRWRWIGLAPMGSRSLARS
ncbi:MATE family multidrug resistance protein [Paraburkholderia sp. BL8N3]|nr:MATE family multidrug resistance protein [Paraburkholderia sp. BL8N3]